jgi:predicted nucleotide-binding protein
LAPERAKGLFLTREIQTLWLGKTKRTRLKRSKAKMALVNGKLYNEIKQKLGLNSADLNALIDRTSKTKDLDHNYAAILLALESGINVSKFASQNDIEILQTFLRSPQTYRERAEPLISPRGFTRPKPITEASSSKTNNQVFVVHGRNARIREAMFFFLRAVGLKPLEWNSLILRTRQASPYIGNILEAAFAEASAIVVLLTPDDIAKVGEEYLYSTDLAYEKNFTGQARPNVLFEAGMAFGRAPDQTVLVQFGDVRPFSDVAGRHILRMDNQPSSRKELITKLSNAGCTVDESGTDWITTGNFEIEAPGKKEPSEKFSIGKFLSWLV